MGGAPCQLRPRNGVSPSLGSRLGAPRTPGLVRDAGLKHSPRFGPEHRTLIGKVEGGEVRWPYMEIAQDLVLAVANEGFGSVIGTAWILDWERSRRI